MLPNREGLFHAYPVDIGVGATKENQLLQVSIVYQIVEELVDGEWVNCSDEGLEITGYHMLEKKDHSLNERTIESLKASLGWDGADPFWLQDNAAELAQKPVQVKLGFEEYEGKTNIRVLFLNPYGSKPAGVTKADDEFRRAAQNRLGVKFRALAGGTPAPAPKPAGRPAPPVPKTAPPKAPAATTEAPTPATMEDAWAAFSAEYNAKPGGSDEDMEQQWFRIIAELFPGKQPDELTEADWGVVLAEGPGKIVPF